MTCAIGSGLTLELSTLGQWFSAWESQIRNALGLGSAHDLMVL